MHPSKSWRRTALAAALLASTALTGVALAQPGPVNPPAMATPAILPDFSGLVAQVKPAVVSITTTISESQAEGPGVPIPLPFPFSQMIPRGGSGVHEARGSGFIIRQDGLIVTNYHVVKDGSAVSVTLDDGRELKAKVIGTDPRTDIAIVKVDAGKPLPFIQLGDSRDVRPGEWVVAMGNPFGLGGTVTAGIVSAVSRDIGSGPYDQFIQVDAPINQGNSGGPLFTQEGKVIGMNSAIFSPTGGSVGIGFAIPSNMIRTVSDQLAATGHVTRGFVGVGTQTVSGAMAKALHLPEASGALLASVASGSPAAKAGLEPGDVVESVNGQKITSPRDLAVTVASVTPGEEAKFQILRDGQDRDIEVKVGEQPPEKTAHAQPDEPSARGQLGLALGSLTPDVRDQLNVPDGTQGALVRSVRSGSPADEAGLRPGDVIVGVGNQKVSSPSDATKAIAAAITAKSHAVALRVLRDGEVAFVGVTVGEAAG
ncbi:MAG: trypsin-like peptidase domain-containing protein [Acetobacteraceae bacterium]|jgi:serine protease Do